MIDRPFDEIGFDDIMRLVDEKVPEGRLVDYKQELPGSSDSAKKEFLFDVTSFANAEGGYIVYGVSEELDDKEHSTSLPGEAKGLICPNPDQEILRLESIIRSGILPAIQGLRIKSIPDFSDGPVILVHVPDSSQSPHWVSVGSDARYFLARNEASAGKHHMSYEEVKEAFAASILAPKVTFSPDAEKVARYLSEHSKNGLTHDPMIPVDDLAEELSMSLEDVEMAVDELKSYGLVFVDPSLNCPSHIWPEYALFWVTDEDVPGDALQLAMAVVDDGREVVDLAQLGERLGWEPRRLNPAATYLAAQGLVGHSDAGYGEYAYVYLQRTPTTQRYVRDNS